MAESEMKNFQVDFRGPFSESMKNRGINAQTFFGKSVTGMSQQSHTVGAAAKPSGSADTPPAILPRSQLAVTTDSAQRTDPATLAHHVTRVHTRLTIMEEMLT